MDQQQNDGIIITDVLKDSLAYKAGIRSGDTLLSVNDMIFSDILEYNYLCDDEVVVVEWQNKNGEVFAMEIENAYEDLGICFEKPLIDDARSCSNKCIFCFIDQLPKNMRESLYFKDDDTRLSLLHGNYVSLTNMKEADIDNLINIRLSPMNISVHTTNPTLRCEMLGNRFAGNIMSVMEKLAENNIYMNGQIVLCPDVNDGQELVKTIGDLSGLFPFMQSLSVVPVGITKYRDGLHKLKSFDQESASSAIETVEELQNKFSQSLGNRFVYAADEFYIKAKKSIPPYEQYEEFPQIENGVGLLADFIHSANSIIEEMENISVKKTVSVATGAAAYPFINSIVKKMMDKAKNITINVYEIKNNFFGQTITVSGLLCGCDIIEQLIGKSLGEKLYITKDMIRDGENLLLDDITTDDISLALNTEVCPLVNDGAVFVGEIIKE